MPQPKRKLLCLVAATLTTAALAQGSVPAEPPAAPQPEELARVISVQFEIESAAEGVTLSGVYEFPKADEDTRYPAILLVGGSAHHDRTGFEFGKPRLELIANELLTRGYAVARYDERGAGKSTGDFTRATTDDLASDAQAIIDFLRTRDEIDPDRVALVGHSEGGLIGFILSTNDDGPDCVVSLGGPAIPGRDIINDQLRGAMTFARAEKDDIERMRGMQDAFLQSVIDDDPRDKQLELLADLTYEQYEGRASMARATMEAEQGLAWFRSPWTRRFLVLDPADYASSSVKPTLALLGTLDIQVSDEMNEEPLREAIESSGVEGSEVRVLESKNHLFQTAQTGWYGEYTVVEHAIADDVLDLIDEWLQSTWAD